jgi:hypothetical protein
MDEWDIVLLINRNTLNCSWVRNSTYIHDSLIAPFRYAMHIREKISRSFLVFLLRFFVTKRSFIEIYFSLVNTIVPSLNASEATLSGLAGGEYLPLPVSKGPAFPFLLALDGFPTSPADFAHGQPCSPKVRQLRKNFWLTNLLIIL